MKRLIALVLVLSTAGCSSLHSRNAKLVALGATAAAGVAGYKWWQSEESRPKIAPLPELKSNLAVRSFSRFRL